MQDVNRRLNEFHARETQAFQRKELANDEVRQLKMEQNGAVSLDFFFFSFSFFFCYYEK